MTESIFNINNILCFIAYKHYNKYSNNQEFYPVFCMLSFYGTFLLCSQIPAYFELSLSLILKHNLNPNLNPNSNSIIQLSQTLIIVMFVDIEPDRQWSDVR